MLRERTMSSSDFVEVAFSQTRTLSPASCEAFTSPVVLAVVVRSTWISERLGMSKTVAPAPLSCDTVSCSTGATARLGYA